MAQICIPTPESVVTHTKKSRSVLRNNLPSQPSCDDVSFLITNCLFMLQQLPRGANKWLKECLDQAFSPLLSGGCYLVDSDGSSCLVWKGAGMGRQWLTEGPSGSARMAPRLYIPAPKGKPGPCLEVGGERKCWRVMKKIFWPNLRSWTLPRGDRSQSKWPPSSQQWAPGAKGAGHFWWSSQAPGGGWGGDVGTHIRSLSSFFSSCFHFVLWYGVLHPQQMHLGPPFKFTVPRVHEGFRKLPFFRTFNWRLTEQETLQHLGKTRSFASWRKCLIRIFHHHLQPLNLAFPFVSIHALHFNTFQGRFECTKSLPSSPCLTIHCSWLAPNICGFHAAPPLAPIL